MTNLASLFHQKLLSQVICLFKVEGDVSSFPPPQANRASFYFVPLYLEGSVGSLCDDRPFSLRALIVGCQS